MAKFVLLVVLTVICAVGYAKHIHPKNMIHTDEDKANEDEVISTGFDDMPNEVIRHIKLHRFVPVNDALLFMNNPPCEEGFERDVLGVCREVW